MPMVSTMPAMPARESVNRPNAESAARMPRYKMAKNRHGRRRDDAEPLVEDEQVEHDHRKADERHDDAREQGVLPERRSDDLALRVLEAHGKRSRLEDGLHGLRLVHGIAARDGHLPVGNRGLDSRGGLHLAVQDDDDLTVRRGPARRSPARTRRRPSELSVTLTA